MKRMEYHDVVNMGEWDAGNHRFLMDKRILCGHYLLEVVDDTHQIVMCAMLVAIRKGYESYSPHCSDPNDNELYFHCIPGVGSKYLNATCLEEGKAPEFTEGSIIYLHKAV